MFTNLGAVNKDMGVTTEQCWNVPSSAGIPRAEPEGAGEKLIQTYPSTLKDSTTRQSYFEVRLKDYPKGVRDVQRCTGGR